MAEHKQRRALTLIELMVVVVVLAIVGALVVPLLSTTHDSQTSAAARIVAADLESARSLARTTMQPHSLVFNPNLTAYKVVADYGGESYVDADAVEHPVRAGQDFEVVLAAQSGMPQVVVGAVDFGGDTYVTFNGLGEPTAAGSITLGAGTMGAEIAVESLTGNVTVTDLSG